MNNSCNCGYSKSLYNPWLTWLVPNKDFDGVLFRFGYFVHTHKILLYSTILWFIPVAFLFGIWYIISLLDDCFDYISFKIIDFIIYVTGKAIEAKKG